MHVRGDPGSRQSSSVQSLGAGPLAAGPPADALLARADELAKRWAIALILARPVERLGEIQLQEFARKAPALCALVVGALFADDELDHLAAAGAWSGHSEPTPAHTLGTLTGAQDGRAVVEAVEALRSVLWQALLEEQREPVFDHSAARRLADQADRLARVCAAVLAAALPLPPSPPVAVRRDEAAPAAPPPSPPLADPAEIDRSWSDLRTPTPARGRAIIIDELEELSAADRSAAELSADELSADERRADERKADERMADERSAEDPRVARPVAVASPALRDGPAASRRQGRPLPWDIPLSDERHDRSPPRLTDEPATDERGRPIIRARRRPAAPVDDL